MAIELFIALALVLANGFFVATEFSLARMRATQLDGLERARRPGAGSVRHGVERIDAYLAACQLGITVASIGLGVVGEPVFEELLEPLLGGAAVVGGVGIAAAMAFGIITLLHVVVGELAPKSLAIARPVSTSLAVSPPMRAFYVLTRPVVDLFNGMGNLLLKPFGIPPAREAGHAPHSEEELRALLRESHHEGLIEREEQEFAENVFEFGDRRVREVMTPRPEIEFVMTDQTPEQAAARAQETGLTRLPLCEPDEGLDRPVGVIHAKDLLSATLAEADASLGDLSRPLGRVSEGTLCGELLRDLRRERQHIALVLDEYGTTVGLVTMEDLIEELVGEIEDEFDPEAAALIERRGDAWIVAGNTPLRLVEREVGISVEDPHEATLGGHLLELFGRLPQLGEQVEIDARRVSVTAVDEARITCVEISGDGVGDQDGASGAPKRDGPSGGPDAPSGGP